MPDHVLKKGLDLPITGSPEQKIHEATLPESVALMGRDFNGMKPKMLIQEGDDVERGTPLFCHKDSPEIQYVAPAKGKVRAINRGARRVLQSVVIDVSDHTDAGVDFGKLDAKDQNREAVQERLYASGLWTSFKTRPYSKVPATGDVPAAIYVTAMDSEPLAADASVVIETAKDAFESGLAALTHLTDGDTYLCHETGANIPGSSVAGVSAHGFSGPHPSGLAGTHMHFLTTPNSSKQVWSIGYQDVIAIGRLMMTGKLDVTRIIAICGPRAKKPRLVKTVVGASLVDLMQGEIDGGDACRVITGSVLSGAVAEGPFNFLGRYDRQVTLITEDREQKVLAWLLPGMDKYSTMGVHPSALLPSKLFNLTSNLRGGRRAMVPTGTFEKLMPQDFLPTQLLRAILVMDTDVAQQLGALELDEEDLALCTFACPGKYEYGDALRNCLVKIEKEG